MFFQGYSVPISHLSILFLHFSNCLWGQKTLTKPWHHQRDVRSWHFGNRTTMIICMPPRCLAGMLSSNYSTIWRSRSSFTSQGLEGGHGGTQSRNMCPQLRWIPRPSQRNKELWGRRPNNIQDVGSHRLIFENLRREPNWVLCTWTHEISFTHL